MSEAGDAADAYMRNVHEKVQELAIRRGYEFSTKKEGDDTVAVEVRNGSELLANIVLNFAKVLKPIPTAIAYTCPQTILEEILKCLAPNYNLAKTPAA